MAMSLNRVPLHRLLTDDEFHAIVSETDELRLAIRGHKVLDACAGLLISEILAEPHEVEIGRLSFPLKLDLLVGLGALPKSERALGACINRLRNRFAHEDGAVISERDGSDLRSSMSQAQQDMLASIKEGSNTPRDLLGSAIAILYTQLEVAVRRNRDAKIESEVLHEMVQERLSRRPSTTPLPPSSRAEQEMRRRVAERKTQLGE